VNDPEEVTGMAGVAIVTGASRGIGAAIAAGLAAEGLAVCINHRASPEEAAGTVAAIERAGGRAVAVAADIGSEAGVVHLFAEVDRLLGPVTVLVNNAAFFGRNGRRVVDLDAATLAQTLQVNVAGVFLACREAVRRMSLARGGKGGRIVNISSTAAERGSANDWVDYAASKAAVNTLTRGLALEHARDGVRVNAVAAGLTDTDSHARAGAVDRVARMSAGVPVGRAGTVQEMADTTVWLATRAPDFMTGAIVPVSGGF